MSPLGASEHDTLTLVRHAETELNVDGRVASVQGAQLTPRGRRQALALRSRWTGRQPTVSRTSDFTSAIRTAELLTDSTWSADRVDRGLGEFRFLEPSFANRTRRVDRAARAASFWARRDPHFADGAGAETFCGFITRLYESLSTMTLSGRTPLVVVTHGVVIAVLQTLVDDDVRGMTDLMGRLHGRLMDVGVVDNCAVVQVWLGETTKRLEAVL